MVKQIWVDIGSGDALLPDGTKPLPQPMLAYYQQGSVALPKTYFTERVQRYQFENEKCWKIHL